ncbi:MAG: hypothetical protein R2862_05445 [Thermoanaerobaculia bacterium]
MRRAKFWTVVVLLLTLAGGPATTATMWWSSLASGGVGAGDSCGCGTKGACCCKLFRHRPGSCSRRSGGDCSVGGRPLPQEVPAASSSTSSECKLTMTRGVRVRSATFASIAFPDRSDRSGPFPCRSPAEPPPDGSRRC